MRAGILILAVILPFVELGWPDGLFRHLHLGIPPEILDDTLDAPRGLIERIAPEEATLARRHRGLVLGGNGAVALAAARWAGFADHHVIRAKHVGMPHPEFPGDPEEPPAVPIILRTLGQP